MNPPFRLGPVLPGSPRFSDDLALPYNRLELAAGAAFVPGEIPNGQVNFTWNATSHIFLRTALSSNFTDRFIFQIQGGARIPLNEMFSLEGSGSAGFGLLFSQERQQGQLAEIIQRDGLTLYLGAEIRVNANITDAIGVYFSASYQREFCGAVSMSPQRLPHSRQAPICEDANILGLGGGIRFGLAGPPPPRIEEDERVEENPVPDSQPEENIERPSAPRFEDLVESEVVDYISDFAALTGEEVRPQIEYVLRHSRFRTLPRSFQKIVILKAIQGDNTENLIFLSDRLHEIDSQIRATETYESIETGISNVLSATGIRLHRDTLYSLLGLRNSSRRRSEDFETSYENARLNLQSALLHYVMNPYARRAVRQYVQDFARERNVSLRSLDNYAPPVISLGRHDLDAACHMEGVGGCANPSSYLNYQELRVSLDKSTPDQAFEVTFHENMHLFSGRTRQQLGCGSNDYNLRGVNYSFPFWMEEALNEINIHAGLRPLARDRQYALEATTDGRLAIERTVRHQGEALNAHWRSMHLFCRADEVRENIGSTLFTRLTTGHRPGDVYGAEFLRRVDRYYGDNEENGENQD